MTDQRIDVPGYGLIDFPANMSDEAIVKAIRNLPLKQPKATLSEDPGAAQSMLIGAGRTTDRVVKGMQQLYYGAKGDDAKLAELKGQAAEDDRLYAPLQEARPWSTGMGEAAPSMLMPVGGSTTLLANALRFGAAGAVPGMLEYGSAGDRFQRGVVGGASGAATPLLGAGVKAGWSLAEPLWEGGRKAIAGRVLNRVAGGSAPAVIQKLKSAAPLVPGSSPTAAQVAESGGIAALERAAAAADPEAYANRAMQQSSARLGALRTVAGDDAQMAAALAARDSASTALYQQADAGVAPIDGFFKGLMMRGQFKSAVARAQELANGDGLSDIFFRGQQGEPVALIGQGAHYIKKALDEAGEYGSNSYTGKTAASSANKTNDLFQGWLSQHVPEYGAAKQAFAAGSKPINQMEIGRALLDKAAPALSDYGALGRETGATYAAALRNGDAVAAKATGLSGARMDSVLTPQQFQSVESVAKDLARKSNAQDLGRGVGSDTFQKLSMQNIAEQSGMPRLTGGLLSLPGVSRATAWAYRDTDQKMQSMLADALLNPAKAASLMENANAKWLQDHPAKRQLLEQAAARVGGLLAAPAAEPFTH